MFNVESENELILLNTIACQLGKKAAIAFRINPDVDAKTHAKISTGKSEDKFGIPISKALDMYQKAAKLDGIEVQGVDVHIGSQLTDLTPFKLAFAKIKQLFNDLYQSGIPISVIDLGGGLGVNYNQKGTHSHGIEAYCQIVNEVFKDLDCQIILEPGRSLVADSGLLVAKTIYTKQGEDRLFLIIDSAMNDFIRPSMYDAFHHIISISKKDTQATYDIVGPVCETGDTFAKNRTMDKMSEGDLLGIANAGAYGSTMSSTYNTRLLIPEVLVKDQEMSIIKKRGDYETLINQDQLAPWQSEKTNQ